MPQTMVDDGEECCYICKVPRVHSGLPVAVESFAVREWRQRER